MMRLKEQRGRDSLFFVFFFFPKEGKREREGNLCGEITSDFNGTLVAKDDERRNSGSKRNRC